MSDSNGGLPIAMVLVTAGGILVYTAYRGISLVDAFAGVTSGSTFAPSPDSQDRNERNTPAPAAGSGLVTVDGHPLAAWVARDVLCARQHGWPGAVTSGWRSDEQQRQACIDVCGNGNGCPGTCAAPGESNHRGKVWPLGAVDVSNPEAFQAALLKCPFARLKGMQLPNDRVHFSATGH